MIDRLPISRYSVALAGAAAITITMFLGMAKVAELFERRDPTQYFRILDVRLQPDDARPRRPPRAAEQPERPRAEFDRPEVSLEVGQPSVELEGAPEAPVAQPRLERPGAAE